MHHYLGEVFSNKILLCCMLSWFIAQLLKVPTYYLVEHKVDWRRMRGSGGMPSSHSAFVVSLAIMVGTIEGFDSSLFAIACILGCIVMYDATGVRRETGKQSQVINEILRNVFVDGKPISEENLKELVGHKPIEVFFGALIGLLTSLFFILFL